MADKIRVGFIGVGNIFPQYVRGCRAFDILEIAAVSDLDVQRAKDRAKEFDIPKACSVDELLADPSIQIVVNLTIPNAHAQVALKVLEAGKHVYGEKPLALSRKEGAAVLELANAKGLRVGCAPDTFLGGGGQTARKLIEDGAIGVPVAAEAAFISHGPESWHPNPEFYYKQGAGPLFDMGPYYLTALVNLLGPVRRLSGSARISFPERIATSKEKYGLKIAVEVPTHVAGVLEFANGAVGTITTSFDVWRDYSPQLMIYGSEGSISVPDPNNFDGDVRLWRAGSNKWESIPLTHRTDVGRGIGVADMAYAIRSGRPHRASAEMAFHVLDLMEGIPEAAQRGEHLMVGSVCPQPAPLPAGLKKGVLDE